MQSLSDWLIVALAFAKLAVASIPVVTTFFYSYSAVSGGAI